MDSIPTEQEIPGLLHDKAGHAYRTLLTISNPAHNWQIFDGKWRIGYVWCTRFGDTFHFGDWKFENEFRRPRHFLGFHVGFAPPLNYRRRGLGTALLPVILAHAKACGCRRIIGSISTIDTTLFPDLVAWYARHGFTFKPGSESGPFSGEISLQL